MPVSICSVLLATLYITANVAGNYRGNISGLFYTGTDSPLPSGLSGAHTWRVRDRTGYDAQYYHLIAHNPLLLSDTAHFLDNARLRWRRIGVPGLAFLAGAGSPFWVDVSYIGIELIFTGLGAFWLARSAERAGLHSLVGAGFLLIPATLVSIDRMTVDVVLAALLTGLVWCASAPSRGGWVYLILVYAPLVRETGAVIVAAWCVWSAARRHWAEAIAGVLCLTPAVAWWSWVGMHAPPDATRWFAKYPFSGVIDRAVSGIGYGTVAWAEALAFAGVCLALALGVYAVVRRPGGLPEITAGFFVAFASALGRADLWDSAYATGRTMSPLLICLVLIGIRERMLLLCLPVVMILPRILLQYKGQLAAAFG